MSAVIAAFVAQYLIERAKADPCRNEGNQSYRPQPGVVHNAKHHNDYADNCPDNAVHLSHILVHFCSLTVIKNLLSFSFKGFPGLFSSFTFNNFTFFQEKPVAAIRRCYALIVSLRPEYILKLSTTSQSVILAETGHYLADTLFSAWPFHYRTNYCGAVKSVKKSAGEPLMMHQ